MSDTSYRDAKSDTSFQDGLEYQDFVCQQLMRHGIVFQQYASKKYQFEHGESLQGFEIKLDERCTETERLSIEVAEKTRNDPMLDWTPSGICRDDNTWLYIQGNYHRIFIFPKNLLYKWFVLRRPETTEKYGTVVTFYLPFQKASEMAAKVIDA